MTDDAVHRVFDTSEFWIAFRKDVSNARARVLIECPFLASFRIRELEKLLRSTTSKGVAVCLFIQSERQSRAVDPEAQSDSQSRERQFLIDLLRSWNVHVNEKNYIHSKDAVIDEDILWDGSLNILCNYEKSGERMNRYVGRDHVRAAIKKQKLHCEQCHQNIARYEISTDQHHFGDWGKILKAQRESQGLTQAEVAASCGLERSLLSKIESGQRGALKSVIKISRKINARIFLVPDHLAGTVGRALGLGSRAENESPALSTNCEHQEKPLD